MTQLIQNGGLQNVIVDDYPLGLKHNRKYMRKEVKVLVPRYRDENSSYSWQTPYWPGCGGLMGSPDGDAGIYNDIIVSVWFDQPDVVSGHAFRYGFVGITRDQYGSPLGNVLLKLFRTLDDTLQDSQTSDANGNYILSTIYLDAHYVVSQKAGPPPVAGATVNTLIAST